MAVQTKTQLHRAVASLPNPITPASLTALLDDMVDSWEDYIGQYTTVQRDLLTPFEGLKIYNTTSNRLEYFNATAWAPMSQKEVVAVNCSANPNYPEALVGDQYIVSVAGLIGGASGKAVFVGDMVYCIVDNAGGAEASVGTSWAVCHSASSTDNPTFYSEITLSSAEILALNVTPKQLVPAPGAGRIIVPLQYISAMTFNSVPYATNVNLRARNPSETNLSNLIFSLDSPLSDIRIVQTQLYAVANENLEVYVSTGNPTAGDSTMTVGVYYKIHTV